MLVELTVENFRSIGASQTFSMVAANRKELEENVFEAPNSEKFSLLKSALIYGANASGKTNLLLSLRALCHLIIESRKYDADQLFACYEPCRVDEDLVNKNISLEIEFYSSDIFDEVRLRRYNFQVEFNSSQIIKEKLSAFKTARPTNVFSRELGKDVSWGNIFTKSDKEFATNKNQLFLSVAGNLKTHFLNKIMYFFTDTLILPPQTHIIGSTSASTYTTLIKNLEKKSEKNSYSSLMKVADIGISNIHVKKRDLDKLNLPEDTPEAIKEALKYELLLTHPLFKKLEQVGHIDFGIEEESDGTKRLLTLANKIFKVLSTGGVFVVDEIETSLHPEISRVILELFSEKSTNPNNAQLIATTHDVTLLNSKRLRRDQVWFAEKNKQAQTNLYSLVEFKNSDLRRETAYGTWYLNGRFGAIPTIGPLTHLTKCDECKG